MASGSETCVSWDFNIQNWTTTGCNTSVGLGGIITCRCNHLTNFAVLVVITCTIIRPVTVCLVCDGHKFAAGFYCPIYIYI